MANCSERLWPKVDIRGPNECWEWTGSTNGNGYGKIRYFDSLIVAHRMAYWLYYGKLDRRLIVRHTCDNKLCCNPHHLIQGTQFENVQDRTNRNRHRVIRGEECSKSKLSDEKVRAIRLIHKSRSDISQRKLARLYGVSQGAICNILNNRTWTHTKA